MKAIVYSRAHGTGTLTDDRPLPTPNAGEVRVRVHRSGMNPIDWKSRHREDPNTPVYVPGYDGAGVIDAVGEGVAEARIGQRVWLWAAALGGNGTAQEYVTLPQRLAQPLPDHASFDLGASVGIPALTAHRCLTLAENGPAQVAPGTLTGQLVLVSGGAGAVGNAAIQLARWAGATVISTVSGPAKAALATAAGAHHVVNYRTENAAEAIRALAPDGVHLVVEVAAVVNAELDRAVLAANGTVAFYAGTDADRLTLPVRELMLTNQRWQGVYLYSIPTAAADHGVAAVSAALADDALRAGEDAGLPLHHFPLARTVEAFDAGERGDIVGKALIELA